MIEGAQKPKAKVLKVQIDALEMKGILQRISEQLDSGSKGYVCLAGVHGVMEVQRSLELERIFAEAAIVVPDGMPTVWVGRHQGHKRMERVAGPDLMLEVMQSPQFRHVSHFLCGGKVGVADELQQELVRRMPWIRIAGTYTPPFSPMSSLDEEEMTAKINAARPDIVWVGISTPKQERFMARYLPRLETSLMFGVGAAFDFHTGRIADCPDWVKHCGLQWFDRLLQDPKHLWKRYLRNNPAFLFHIALQLAGLKSYERRPSTTVADGQALSAPKLAKPQPGR